MRRAPSPPAPEEWTIEPIGLGFRARVEEFWRYRRLLTFFAVRSTRGMYQRFTLGIFWLFARPLLPLLIGAFIFGRLLGVPSDGLPYFLFYLAGHSIWHFFERALLFGTRSLERQKGLVKKMYFPRLILPIAGVVPAFTDLGVYLGLLVLSAGYYLWQDGKWYLSFGPGWAISLAVLLVTTALAVALSMFTAVWQVRHREVRFTLRYFLRFWSYLTPIIYPMSQVPEHLHWVIYLNPMASLVETYKWGLLGVGQFPVVPLACTALLVPILFVAGTWYFMRSEAASVDEL
ncbi:MAG: ABC transporter permease [Vicinamibacterales bacterium]